MWNFVKHEKDAKIQVANKTLTNNRFCTNGPSPIIIPISFGSNTASELPFWSSSFWGEDFSSDFCWVHSKFWNDFCAFCAERKLWTNDMNEKCYSWAVIHCLTIKRLHLIKEPKLYSVKCDLPFVWTQQKICLKYYLLIWMDFFPEFLVTRKLNT